MLTICLYRDIKESEKYKASKSRLTFPVGLENDVRYVVDTLDNSGSLLITGCSQCGKTMFLKSVLRSLIDRNTQETADFYIFTRKADELDSFRHYPQVAGFTSDFGDMNDTLKAISMAKTEPANKDKYTFIFIDELADYLVSDYGNDIATRIFNLSKMENVYFIATTEVPSIFNSLDESEFRSSDEVLRVRRVFKTVVLGVLLDSNDAFILTRQRRYPRETGEWMIFKAGQDEYTTVVGALILSNDYSITDEVNRCRHPEQRPNTPENTLYLAWEKCRKYFHDNRELARRRTKEAEQVREFMALHLTAYLASTGMYRASTFLARYCDYTRHSKVVDILLDPVYEPLWDFNPLDGKLTDEIARLLFIEKSAGELPGAHWNGLVGRLELAYSTPSFPLKATDTLITDIINGTMGCIPCYDTLFKRSIEALNNVEVVPVLHPILSEESFRALCNFMRYNSADFGDLLASSEYEMYTPMRLLDMYMWQVGIDSYKQDYSRKRPEVLKKQEALIEAMDAFSPENMTPAEEDDSTGFTED